MAQVVLSIVTADYLVFQRYSMMICSPSNVISSWLVNDEHNEQIIQRKAIGSCKTGVQRLLSNIHLSVSAVARYVQITNIRRDEITKTQMISFYTVYNWLIPVEEIQTLSKCNNAFSVVLDNNLTVANYCKVVKSAWKEIKKLSKSWNKTTFLQTHIIK